jgi:L-fucose dehydrogenase
MDLELGNKVVLITGGANGIGAAIVRLAAEENAIPIIVDRDAEAAHKLCQSVHDNGRKCCVIGLDLSCVDNCAKAVTETLRICGRIDALINNAGGNDHVGLEQGSPSEYVKSLQRNLLHCYNMAHFALPSLKQFRGCIVNIGSKTAITGQSGTSGYVSAKGAIHALTREWAAELSPSGIRVNAVVPAEVLTEGYQRWLDTFPHPEQTLQTIADRIPLGKRMTTPEEIAAMVLFLISSKAAHITGQHIFVDGGYVHLDRALTQRDGQ